MTVIDHVVEFGTLNRIIVRTMLKLVVERILAEFRVECTPRLRSCGYTVVVLSGKVALRTVPFVLRTEHVLAPHPSAPFIDERVRCVDDSRKSKRRA
jgi:hypothetical protein